MKRFLTFLTILAMIFSFQELQSQSLREKVMQRLSKEKVEDNSEDDSQTVVETDDASESSNSRFSNSAMMDAFGLTGNVAYEPDYNFNAYIQMEITSYKKNGKLDDQVVYDNYVHKTKADYAMVFRDGSDKSTIIFDTKNSAMLILTDSDGEKSGFATTIDPEAMAEMAEDYEEEEVESELDTYNIKKTGKKKEILGYSCDEYLMEDEYSEVHMWVSEKLGKEMRKEWMNNKQTFGTMFTHANALNGMVLEYDVLDKDDGNKSIMLVTKIDLNHSHSVATGGYTVMSMRMKTDEEKE
ncbi:MAG: DUF4412 domain-containing protein [Bacteroidales bacterium]|nr:DUF4412 domain-containing protein [Bacteroidales bacterium]